MSVQKQLGDIYVIPEEECFYIGQKFSGEVRINLNEDYPGKDIVLKIIGKEYGQWTNQIPIVIVDSDGIKRQRHKTEHFFGKNYQLRHKYIIYTFEEQIIPKGQYSIPIQFRIPENIPGSFKGDRLGIVGYVKYQLDAEIESLDNRVMNIGCSQIITIREPISNLVEPVVSEGNIFLRNWYCFNKGNIYIKAYFNKNAYLSGEVATLSCEIDNQQCSVDIQLIRFTLVNIVSCQAKKGQSKQIVSNVMTQMQKGVKAKDKATKHNKIEVNIKLERIADNVTQDLQPCTAGDIISNRYYVEIEILPNMSTTCSYIPKLHVPLNIYASSTSSNVEQQLPQEWNPVILSTANLVVTNSYLIKSITNNNIDMPTHSRYSNIGTLDNQSWNSSNDISPIRLTNHSLQSEQSTNSTRSLIKIHQQGQ